MVTRAGVGWPDGYRVGEGASLAELEQAAGRRIYKRRGARQRPALLEEFAELIGAAAAMALIEAYPGARLYVPRKPGEHSRIAQVIGMAATLRLAAMYGGETLQLPRPPDLAARIIALRQQGLTAGMIAQQLHCTRRRVFQVLADARESGARGC